MITIFRKIFFLLIILLLANPLNLYSAAGFLEIGVGSAAIGTGEACVGKSDDFSASYWNPAGLSFINNMLAGFHMFLYYEGMKMNNISVILPGLDNNSFGISTTAAFIYDDIPATGVNSDGTIIDYNKNYSCFDMNFMISYAKRMSTQTAVGFNIKYIHSRIEEESAGTFAFDTGILTKGILYNDLNLGFVLVNLGPGLTYIEETASLPSAAKIGLSKVLFAAANNNHKIFFLNDHIVPFYNVYMMNSGLEYVFKNSFFLRAGYQYSKSKKQFAFGAGANFDLMEKNFALNLAFLPFSDLNNLVAFDLSIRRKHRKRKIEEKREEEKKIVEERLREEKEKLQLLKEEKIKKELERQRLLEAQREIEKAKTLEDAPTLGIAELKAKNVAKADAEAATEFLRTALVNIDKFRVLDRAKMEIILKEQEFQLTGCTSTNCIVQMGRILNMQYMVSGSYGTLMDEFYISVHIINVETGEIVFSGSETYESIDDFEKAVNKLALDAGEKIVE